MKKLQRMKTMTIEMKRQMKMHEAAGDEGEDEKRETCMDRVQGVGNIKEVNELSNVTLHVRDSVVE